jgi:methanol--5-hydroxybenzimidazolylcobamide Co-methyltransferase
MRIEELNMSGIRKKFNSLAIDTVDDLVFGRCKYPVTCGNDLVIGNGFVYPEINFTLPAMTIDSTSWPVVLKHYKEIAENLSIRAKALELPGLVLEFEQLPPMTQNPKWGAEITHLLKESLNDLYERSGIPNALRVTVVDIRDLERPPLLRRGTVWDQTYEAFRTSAEAGADILSVESVGGKEVHDQALMYGDLKGIIASMGILSSRDMAWLWKHISDISVTYNCVAGGDTACGFSNTAMQLAGQGMLPNVLAALDRAASAPRSLVAYEYGAIGPSKDCAYEGPIIKAITGYPISMEGKSSSCAHFSPLGNIAGAMADLWSNESVQNIRLLSGNAPEAFLELLAYDCRLYNTAHRSGNPLVLRDWLVDSDLRLNVQALMLEPSVVLNIAKAIAEKNDSYEQTIAAVREAFNAIESAESAGSMALNTSEKNWFHRLKKDIEIMPETHEQAVQYLCDSYGDHFLLESYGL